MTRVPSIMLPYPDVLLVACNAILQKWALLKSWSYRIYWFFNKIYKLIILLGEFVQLQNMNKNCFLSKLIRVSSNRFFLCFFIELWFFSWWFTLLVEIFKSFYNEEIQMINIFFSIRQEHFCCADMKQKLLSLAKYWTPDSKNECNVQSTYATISYFDVF